MTDPAAPPAVDVRPLRLVRTCRGLALLVVVVFAVLAVALGNAPEGDVRFLVADQIAFFVLGLLLAGAVLLLTRARVVADLAGVAVQNALTRKQVPWEVVRDVRLDDGASWAVLDLHDDETVQLLAVQSNDGDAAVDAVLGLRALLRASRARRGPAADA